MKTKLTALLAIYLCWAMGCGKGEPTADPREVDDGRSEPAADPKAGDEEKAEPAADKPLPKDLESLKALAEKGDAKAQYNLGVIYYYGQGVSEDGKEAVKWYRKAAEQGHAEAQLSLGKAYFQGDTGRPDDKEAVKWYRKAAEQGNAKAQFALGTSYTIGQGVLQDYVTAYAWINIAGANGFDVEEIKTGFDIKEIKKSLEEIKKHLNGEMTADQIAEGQKLSREMIKKNPMLLNK